MILWSILLIISVVLTVALIAFVLPKFFLAEELLGANNGKFFSFDRGIKKINDDGDVKRIVYAPAPKYRRAVDRYSLSYDGNKITFMAHACDDVNYLDYDVILFDDKNKVFKVLNVREKVGRDGVTKEIELPKETSYVNVRVNVKDEEKFSVGYTKKIPAKNTALFLLFNLLILALELIFLRVCCAGLVGGLYKESFLLDGDGIVLMIALSAAALAVDFIVVFAVLKSYGKRTRKNNGE